MQVDLRAHKPLDMNGCALTIGTLAIIADQLSRDGEIWVINCLVSDPKVLIELLNFTIETEENDGVTLRRAVYRNPERPLDERGHLSKPQPQAAVAPGQAPGDEGGGDHAVDAAVDLEC